jgi:hypothetical protein
MTGRLDLIVVGDVMVDVSEARRLERRFDGGARQADPSP